MSVIDRLSHSYIDHFLILLPVLSMRLLRHLIMDMRSEQSWFFQLSINDGSIFFLRRFFFDSLAFC